MAILRAAATFNFFSLLQLFLTGLLAAALSSPAPSRRPYGGSDDHEDFADKLDDIKEQRAELEEEAKELKETVKERLEEAQKLLDKHDDKEEPKEKPGRGRRRKGGRNNR